MTDKKLKMSILKSTLDFTALLALVQPMQKKNIGRHFYYTILTVFKKCAYFSLWYNELKINSTTTKHRTTIPPTDYVQK